MMTFSVTLNENEAVLVQKYAELNAVSIPELLRQSVMERIEDEYDLQDFDKAMQEFQATPQTYTLDEIKAELGLQ